MIIFLLSQSLLTIILLFLDIFYCAYLRITEPNTRIIPLNDPYKFYCSIDNIKRALSLINGKP